MFYFRSGVLDICLDAIHLGEGKLIASGSVLTAAVLAVGGKNSGGEHADHHDQHQDRRKDTLSKVVLPHIFRLLFHRTEFVRHSPMP